MGDMTRIDEVFDKLKQNAAKPFFEAEPAIICPVPIWVKCPECKQKLCRIELDSMARKIYLWCKCCKKEVEVNI